MKVRGQRPVALAVRECRRGLHAAQPLHRRSSVIMAPDMTTSPRWLNATSEFRAAAERGQSP